MRGSVQTEGGRAHGELMGGEWKGAEITRYPANKDLEAARKICPFI